VKKRILAWVLLVGFVLLLLNILLFRFYLELSSIVYIIIIVAFLLTGGNMFRHDGKHDEINENDLSGTGQNDRCGSDDQKDCGKNPTDRKDNEM